MKSEIKIDNNRLIFLLILISYVFSIAVRLIWVFQSSDTESFKWNDQLMLNTNDGYYFAYGALQELMGVESLNPKIQYIYNNGLVLTTFIFAKILPFSFETVILYLPAFISSLIVIPIILIGNLFKNLTWGFASALLISITWSFYNRTMVGYYDTDMFSVMMLIFIFYLAVKSTLKFNLKNILYLSILTTIYPYFYSSGKVVVFSMLIFYIGYILYFFNKNENIYKAIVLIIIGLMPIIFDDIYGYLINVFLVVFVFFILNNIKLHKYYVFILIFISSIILLITGNYFDKIYSYINMYLFHKEGLSEVEFNFFMVNKTIREASAIPFSTLANRISGSEISLLLAGVGYFLLIFKHRVFLISIPLVIIGLLAYKFGLRFTIYALPFAGMSVIFLLIYISKNIFKENNILKYILILIGTIALLYPNIEHIIGYRVDTTFTKNEVKDLDDLNKISSRKDYVITWWDYGYPIHFYANLSTLIDGGKHQHDNYIASSILLSDSQEKTANFSRLAIETYVKSNFKISIDTILKKYNYDDLMIDIKNKNFKLPVKTRDIFIYMPYKMINILSTIDLFSNLDLKSGDKLKSERKIYHSSISRIRGHNIKLLNNIILNVYQGTSNVGKIKQIDSVLSNSKIITKHFYNNEDGLYAIFLQKKNYLIIVDEAFYNSAYIQMLFLNKYDKNLFELMINSNSSKIYKLRI